MPATLRSTSRSVVAPCSSITERGMTVIVCGMSRSGSVNFGESTRGMLPCTSTDSRTPRTSIAIEPGAVMWKARLVPSSSAVSAASGANTPETPGECIIARVSAGRATARDKPVAASNARRLWSRGPAGDIEPHFSSGAGDRARCRRLCGCGCPSECGGHHQGTRGKQPEGILLAPGLLRDGIKSLRTDEHGRGPRTFLTLG